MPTNTGNMENKELQIATTNAYALPKQKGLIMKTNDVQGPANEMASPIPRQTIEKKG